MLEVGTSHDAELSIYTRLPFEPTNGAGCLLSNNNGKQMLDLYAGHAVAVTGHCHPRVVEAIKDQADQLIFMSNLLPLDVRRSMIEKLVQHVPGGLEQAFLANSGAEANEAALQMARRATGRRRVVSCDGGFHGRSLATLSISGIPRFRELASISGGQALVDLTLVSPWDDPQAIEAHVDESVAAVIIEPVQGLAGARAASPEFLRIARKVCDLTGAKLIFDEVQCGCARVGAFTAAERYGVTPDLLTLAKGLGAGVPIGAVLIQERLARRFTSGDFGTTFGGGPIACAAAAANIQLIDDEDLAENALKRERQVRQLLAQITDVVQVTGMGLMLGLVLDRPAKPVYLSLFDRGILVGTSVDPSVLRLLPPLIVSEQEIDTFAATLYEVLQ
ncbi:MAG: aspartate aminotransferase family protein [bacterium]|nr:aspartate aminotransferase family protein [bacterium]